MQSGSLRTLDALECVRVTFNDNRTLGDLLLKAYLFGLRERTALLTSLSEVLGQVNGREPVSTPESARASNISFSIRTEVVSSSLRISVKASRYSASGRGFRNESSAVVRMRATGVRNSWEASAVD